MRVLNGRLNARHTRLTLLFGLCVLTACANNSSAPKTLGDASRVIVAPLNLAVKLPVELKDGVEPVRQSIIGYLQQRDAHVAVVWPSDAWDVWKLAMLETEHMRRVPSRRLDKAVALFLGELSKDTEFGSFILPTLVYREAKLWGDTARWDGVRRRVDTRNRVAGNAGPATLTPSIGEAHVSNAQIPGVSLHVLVYRADGRRVYEGWGGLDLAHAILVTGEAETGHGRLVRDADPFDNLDNLKEGVALALDAYEPAAAR